MKDNKKFFYNNRLNKGYSKVIDNKRSDVSLIRKKYKHVLPPLDIVEEYEEQHPGTFDKIFDMAQKEQEHRHSMDLLEIEKHAQATKMGRIFALVFVTIITLATLLLTMTQNFFMAVIFASLAFATITIVSYFYSKSDHNKSDKKDRSFNNRHLSKHNKKI
jgi:uncharacterized membrane protein